MGNTIRKEVPVGIRYMSEWKDFGFHTFPSKCIVNKQIPGCGYTEWAITCPYHVIIASPRKMLLQNKKDQHPEVFLVENKNEFDLCYDKDLNLKNSKKGSVVGNEKDQYVNKLSRVNFRNELYLELKEYLNSEIFSLDNICRKSKDPNKKYAKILVTYDSYYIVKGILENLKLFGLFHTVVDEMQSILSDSRFKSDAELKLMKSLENVDKVQFISATPILDKYIQMIDDFKSIPYCELDWETLDPSRVKKPEFEGILTMSSVGNKLCENIERYKSGNFVSKYVVKNGVRELITSTEAVFYVNSVKHIISAIKKCGLSPSEVNILCSDTPENRSKLRRDLGTSFKIGTVPLKGEPRKMFTFCTRTVYLGADFYSDCARSFIFSDANSDCLSVDISQDLPQIFGRQRLIENPWKNCATLYYRSTADYKRKTRQDFESEIKKKIKSSTELLGVYRGATKDQQIELLRLYESNAKRDNYKNDYVSVTNKEPVFNHLAYVSEIRSFDIQQLDYSDRFTVFSNLTSISSSRKGDDKVAEFLQVYQGIKGKTWERLKMICEFFFENGKEVTDNLIDNLQDVDPAKEIFLAAGPEQCRLFSYRISEIKKSLGAKKFVRRDLDMLVYSSFREGEMYKKCDIKSRLQEIFDETGYPKKAKATSIEEWFKIENTSTRDENRKKVECFRLTERLDKFDKLYD